LAEREATKARLDHYRRNIPGKGNWVFKDEQVDWAITIAMFLLPERIEHWRDEDGRGVGGVQSRTPMFALLVAMILGACELAPYLGTTYTDILYKHVSPAKRAQLGVGNPPDPADDKELYNVYHSVVRRMHTLFDLMDPSPLPLNRRRTPAEFEAATKDLSPETIALRYDRLCWFINRIIEASLQVLPREFRRRWNGHIGIDSTPIRAYSGYNHCTFKRRADGQGWEVDQIITHASDSTAGPYARSADHRDISHEPRDRSGKHRPTKAYFAHEASLTIMGPDGPTDDDGTIPYLFVSMAPLHKPGHDPGGNGTVAVASIAERGYPAGVIAGDRLYTASDPDKYARPVRALGYEPILDYRDDQLGIQGHYGGFIEVEGAFYCPTMPPMLIMATEDYRAKRIDEDQYQQRLRARTAFLARPNAKPDAEGHQRMMCPASGAAPTARCELKPKSRTRATAGKTLIPVTAQIRDLPPKCCRQQTLTIPPDAISRYHQAKQYGTPAWHASYALLRNAIEGGNGHLKEASGPAIGDAGRRRIRGIAAQSVFVALGLFGLNLERINSFLMTCVVGEDGVLRTKAKERARQQRRDVALQDYTPTLHTGDPPSPN
jgi:hypothetical protein